MHLVDLVLSITEAPGEARVLETVTAIQQAILATSKDIRTANFRSIRPSDLASLFDLYDQKFFQGLCRQSLGGRKLTFRFAPRMTSAAGKTTRFTFNTGEVTYEIAIASSMLYDGFNDNDHRGITACGVECATRLDALQRVFEHELVHLIEHLCWDDSNCGADRFQHIASRWFLHKSHQHQLITRRERAAASGILPGSRVTFLADGQRYHGVVNRVTKRATVLIEDPVGMRYSDGKRYRKFYVPLAWLELAT
jgi:hypothetical protein